MYIASNFASAKRRKEDRYAPLIADLEARGLTVIYVTLELGTLGHYTKAPPPRALQLIIIMPSTARGVLSNLLKPLAKIAIGCSQTIFNARHSILVYIKNCSMLPNSPLSLFLFFICTVPLLSCLCFCIIVMLLAKSPKSTCNNCVPWGYLVYKKHFTPCIV